jgi:hypothetical protein
MGWVVCGLLLTGCASVMRVDSQVQAHAFWIKNGSTASPSGMNSYEFERLPSQHIPPTQDTGVPTQPVLEQLLQEVLAPVGWQVRTPLDQGQAQGQGHLPQSPWRVQVMGQQQTLPRAPWDDPPERLWLRPRAATSKASPTPTAKSALHFNGWLRGEMPYFIRHVSIVIRDPAQGRVVYETQATHEGRWPNSPALWRAMMEAALRGFPHPPAGVQQVDVDLPR